MDTDMRVLFEAINALGVVGLLMFMVLAFYRGDLIARNLLDRILSLYEEQLDQLSQRILAKLEEVMKKD
ncbi:MAG: hypothetical protein KF701_04885 [Anaerolineales bacterium]|nr:MAG: hypothetical protein KF701_04885 [Anaerolineales bacterium]